LYKSEEPGDLTHEKSHDSQNQSFVAEEEKLDHNSEDHPQLIKGVTGTPNNLSSSRT
jgi:hypothetical protein